MTMGEYIKKLRQENGWSMDELGKKVGVNRAAVQKWENGSVENIKRSTIKKLSEIFGVSPCDLMQWDDFDKKEDIQEIQKEVNVFELIEQSFGKDACQAFADFVSLDTNDRLIIMGAMDRLKTDPKYSTQEGLRNA